MAGNQDQTNVTMSSRAYILCHSNLVYQRLQHSVKIDYLELEDTRGVLWENLESDWTSHSCLPF